MEGQAKVSRKQARKSEIGVCLFAAQAVVQMGRVQHQAQLFAPLSQCAHQGNGVRAAGEANGEAKSGLEQFRVDGQRGAHPKIITGQCGISPVSVPICAD